MRLPIAAAAAVICLLPLGARAALMDGTAFTNLALPPQGFAPSQNGTSNPVETYIGVPGYGTVTVSYGPYFAGQSASSFSSTPIGVGGSPSAPLTLDTGPGVSFDTSYQTVVEPDAATTQLVLGGTPAVATNGFGGPVAILLSTPVAGLTLTAGFLDAVNSITLEAFTAGGQSLGTVSNTATGFETFNLSDSAGQAFSGLLITSTDLAGFGINGLGIAASGAPSPVPAPAGAVVLPGLLLWAIRRRRRR